jgi:hypothetical protein
MSATKVKRMTPLEKAEQAIANLFSAIKTLTDEGASEEAIAPYRENLKSEMAKLKRILKRQLDGK